MKGTATYPVLFPSILVSTSSFAYNCFSEEGSEVGARYDMLIVEGGYGENRLFFFLVNVQHFKLRPIVDSLIVFVPGSFHAPLFRVNCS